MRLENGSGQSTHLHVPTRPADQPVLEHATFVQSLQAVLQESIKVTHSQGNRSEAGARGVCVCVCVCVFLMGVTVVGGGGCCLHKSEANGEE